MTRLFTTKTEQKKHNGFTLMEVLITVAIIIVLCALTIPSLPKIKTGLETTALNQTAKEIYMAAQDRLAQERHSDNLEHFSTVIKDNEAGLSGEQKRNLKSNTAFGGKPGDYGTDSNWESLYFVKDSDATFMSYVLAPDAIRNYTGEYIIELNPETGDVYSVFYSESDSLLNKYLINGAKLYGDRSKATLKSEKVGYWNGKTSDSSGEGKIAASFNIDKPFNGEELYTGLTISFDKLSFPDGMNINTAFDDLQFIVTMTDEHGSDPVVKTFTKRAGDIAGPIQNIEDNECAFRVEMVMDSMAKGKEFSSFAPGLYPGDNITMTAQAVCSSLPGGLNMQSENSVTFNSLYAEGTFEGDHSKDILVAKLRHLNNLSIYGTATGKKNEVSKVIQTKNIDYDFDNTSSAEYDVRNFSETTRNVGAVNPLKAEGGMDPVRNDYLFGKSGVKALTGGYDGQGNVIKNMDILQGESGSGLFEYANCNLTGINLANPLVKGGSNSGALAGNTYGGTVDSCSSYVSTKYCYNNAKSIEDLVGDRYICATDGTNNIGGLIGRADSTAISNSFGAVKTGKSNCTQVGGLCGNLSGGSITNCYGSGPLSGKTNVGGITGTNSGTISGSFSTSDITAGTNNGGLSGNATGNISNSTYYGKMTAGTGCGVYVGSGSTGTVSGCRYLQQNEYNSEFKDAGNQSYDTFNADAKANDSVNSHPYVNDTTDIGNVFPFAYLKKDGTVIDYYGKWPKKLEEPTKTEIPTLVYYEKYQKGSETMFGAHAYRDGVVAVDTLLKADQDGTLEGGWTLIEDGYGIFMLNDEMPSPQTTIYFNGAEYSAPKFSESVQSIGRVKINSTQERTLYVFKAIGKKTILQPIEWVEPGTCSDYYRKVGIESANGTQLGSMSAYYDPLFAKAAYNFSKKYSELTDADKPNVLSTGVCVRSARQLNNLGRYEFCWNKVNNTSVKFNQEISIDFSKYVKTYYGIDPYDLTNTASGNTYRNKPIGRSGAAFKNDYNGQGCRIYKYSLATSDSTTRYSGLFGYIDNSSIRNVHMMAYTSKGDTLSGSISQTLSGSENIAVGGLVGQVGDNGTVENCSISGYKVTAKGSGNLTSSHNAAVGGLIGCSSGSVKYCTAVNDLTELSTTGTIGAYLQSRTVTWGLGGLIGSKINGECEYCYAGGKLAMSYSSTTGYGNKTFNVGGVSGGTANVYSTSKSKGDMAEYVRYCYSYCTASNVTSGKYYGDGVNAIDCMYLDDKENSYVQHAVTAQENLQIDSIYYDSNIIATTKGIANIEYDSFVTPDKVVESYPWSNTMTGKYPLSGIIKRGNVQNYASSSNDHVHYGDYPFKEIESDFTGRVGMVKAVNVRLALTLIYVPFIESAYNNYGQTGMSYSLNSLGIPGILKSGDYRTMDWSDYIFSSEGNYYIYWNVPESEYKNWSVATFKRTRKNAYSSWGAWELVNDPAFTMSELPNAKGLSSKNGANAAVCNGSDGNTQYVTKFTYTTDKGNKKYVYITYGWNPTEGNFTNYPELDNLPDSINSMSIDEVMNTIPPEDTDIIESLPEAENEKSTDPTEPTTVPEEKNSPTEPSSAEKQTE